MVAMIAAALTGSALAAGIASGSTSPQTVTLGSTSGTPSAYNLCGSGINCTYVPFTNVLTPGLAVPFAGTVTSFSVNSGSSGGAVELRVLRPAANGQFTGAGTSPPETLNVGVSAFTISLPVQPGDVLGLDNATSALMFDTGATSPTPITSYYEPALADGATEEPNLNQSGYRLLLSATVQASSATTTTTTTSTTVSTATPPRLTDVRQSQRVWREGHALASFSRDRPVPIGTTFAFGLNEPATVTLTFTHQLAGRRVNGKCVAETKANERRRSCKRPAQAHGLRFDGHAGANQVRFQGRLSRSRRLPPGPYSMLVSATNAAHQQSRAVTLHFTIVKEA
jgi:hypothetical protein